MPTVTASRPHKAAILAALGAFNVGDGTRPPGVGHDTDPFTPYAVAYSLNDLDRTGPLRDGQADVTLVFQLTSVGITEDQAGTYRDAIRAALLTATLTVAGRHINRIELGVGGAVDRDPDESPPLFYAVDEFHVLSTPDP